MKISKTFAAFTLALGSAATSASFATAQEVGASPAPLASPPAPGGLVVGESTSGAYVLGRDDVIRVGLLGRNDFGGAARVQSDGMIQMPLIGKIMAAEHTTAELAEVIRKALQTGGYYADPIVNIEVVSYASRYVTVLGAVGSPGLVPLNRPYKLSEILAKVGGVRGDAADYLVVKSADGTEKHPVIKEIAIGDASKDPFVSPGDKIYAPAAEVYYLTGAIHSPGMFPMTGGDITIRMAMAKAGGVSENGNDKKVQVTRAGKQLTLDPNQKILPGDVIYVKEKLF